VKGEEAVRKHLVVHLLFLGAASVFRERSLLCYEAFVSRFFLGLLLIVFLFLDLGLDRLLRSLSEVHLLLLNRLQAFKAVVKEKLLELSSYLSHLHRDVGQLHPSKSCLVQVEAESNLGIRFAELLHIFLGMVRRLLVEFVVQGEALKYVTTRHANVGRPEKPRGIMHSIIEHSGDGVDLHLSDVLIARNSLQL